MLCSIIRVVCWLGLLGMAPAAWGFQNLDFEETLFDFDPLRTSSEEDSFDPAIVTPGWNYRVELPDGRPTPDSDFGVPASAHGSLIMGHIGATPQVILANTQDPIGITGDPLDGSHSLFLQWGVASPSQLDLRSIPVAVQTGAVPEDTQSLLVLVEPRFFGEPVTPLESNNPFSVRLNGFEVEMHPVDVADYPDVSLLPSQGTFYAGNIAPVAGLIRELAIRPEPVLGRVNDFDQGPFEEVNAGIVLDNVAFSSTPSPFTPVQVPEPSAGLLLMSTLLCRSGRRRR